MAALKERWAQFRQNFLKWPTWGRSQDAVAQDESVPIAPKNVDDRAAQSVSTLTTEKKDHLQEEVDKLRASGLLDREWYLERYPDVQKTGHDPCHHFCVHGWKEGRNPNAYFDTSFYRAQMPETERDSINPVLHYLQEGEGRGLKPVLYFDPVWYRAKYGLPETESPLRHYLQYASSGKCSPIPEFDVDFYLDTYPDIRKAHVDPFQHYLNDGFREGRNPSRDFYTRYYVHRYLNGSTQNPLLHYLAHKGDPGIQTGVSGDEAIWLREIRRFTSPGLDFEEFHPLAKGRARLAKVLAFYLPQYYSFPENDEWWGKGFTEWTNVARGAPRFKNHYQPRIPRDLGFYDLLSSETIRRQIQMARGAGLFGFVFYFYWFNGLRLLERPLDKLLSDPTLDFPFCLMWANENWTRRWDGFDDHVLMRQNYDPNHEVALINTFVNYFRDTRYIRIEHRPLLMIYRPGLFPDAAETFRRWRRLFSEIANENPLIIMAQGFGDLDPRRYGLDGAIEHPPHKVMDGMPNINDDVVVLDPDFSGHVYSYQGVMKRSVTEPAPPFPLIKTAFPGWDNDARSQGTGMIVHGSSPNAFEQWLSELIRYAGLHPVMGEKFVCVNAWNEWAEGAYLEPDLHFGAAYLNAAARAITAAESKSAAGRIVLVGHDAGLCYSQLLNIAKVCGRRFGMSVEMVLLAEGPRMESYREVGSTTACNEPDRLEAIFGQLYRRGFRYAVLNSVASLPAARVAKRAAFVTTALMHEQEENASQPTIEETLDHVDRFVFPAEPVRDQFLSLFPAALKRTAILSSRVDISMEETPQSNQVALADYVATLLDSTIDGYVKISVVVLNHNDARYLEGRLASVFSQTYPLFEIIVLDGGSSDASLAELDRIRASVDRDFVVLQNETHAESTFQQWHKAAEIARGDFIWIAEAVDEAGPRFLERLAHAIIDHPNVQLAYTDSRVVDHNGQELLPSYKSYCDESAPGAFEQDRVVEAREFVRHYLSERNLILNVSSAVLRRTTLLSALERVGSDLFSLQQAGDWRLYVEMLAAGGSVAYVAEPLNVHRRHRPSKTRPLDVDQYVEEIRRVQQTVQQIIGPNEELASRQSRYRSAVARQLGAGLPVESGPTEAWLDRAYSLVQGYTLSCADGKHAAEFDEIHAAVNGHIGATDVRQGTSDASESTASAK